METATVTNIETPSFSNTPAALFEKIKNNNEDFEFYPTTNEIINAVIHNLDNYDDRKFSSFLDIGAGNGKVLSAIKEKFSNVETYAIEKSKTLLDSLDKSIYIIGTDFYEQSLLDKNIDVTFCNPPYSDFVQWSKKIIKESTSKIVYLVIPTRWKESTEITHAMKYRDAQVKILGEYSFTNAEDRAARATVNLIRIKLSNSKDDAFDKFFNEEFKDLLKKFEEPKEQDEHNTKSQENKFTHLVLGSNYVKSLCEMYRQDLINIERNYQAVGQLDYNLLKEFDIIPSKILHCLKERMSGLKTLYWNELLSRMKEITDRLISKKRNSLFETLHKNGHVDFTETNVYAVVLWILKNATQYIDEQLITVYEELISKANCHNYKSNQKVFEYNRWRYNDEKPTHFFLDFRIIVARWGSLDHRYGSNDCRLSEHACEQIQDIMTIANNLGFTCNSSDPRLYRWGDYCWIPGKPQVFDCTYKGKSETLIEVKAHLNGNLHIRMNQKFALALNVEFGRLKGWLHSGKEANEEIKDTNAGQYFNSNFTLLQNPFIAIEHKPNQTANIESNQLDLFAQPTESDETNV